MHVWKCFLISWLEIAWEPVSLLVEKAWQGLEVLSVEVVGWVWPPCFLVVSWLVGRHQSRQLANRQLMIAMQVSPSVEISRWSQIKKLLPSFNLISSDEYYKAVVRIFVKKEFAVLSIYLNNKFPVFWMLWNSSKSEKYMYRYRPTLPSLFSWSAFKCVILGNWSTFNRTKENQNISVCRYDHSPWLLKVRK